MRIDVTLLPATRRFNFSDFLRGSVRGRNRDLGTTSITLDTVANRGRVLSAAYDGGRSAARD